MEIDKPALVPAVVTKNMADITPSITHDFQKVVVENPSENHQLHRKETPQLSGSIVDQYNKLKSLAKSNFDGKKVSIIEKQCRRSSYFQLSIELLPADGSKYVNCVYR